MVEFFIDFMLVKVVLVVDKEGCVEEVLFIVLMFGEVFVFFFWLKDKKIYVDSVCNCFIVKDGGDYFIFLNVWN